MKKKILTLAAGLTVLVAGVVTVVKVADKSSSPIKEEKKEVDSAEYEAAFQAVSKAESSNAEEDIQATQALVDKLGKKGAALQVRLDDLKSKLAAWKELDALLIVAETNPTDDAAIQAAKTKYDELMGDSATKFYRDEKSYYLRVHGLQYKKADAIVSQAENTLINSDYQTAVDFYNGHLQQYFKNYSIEVKDPQTGEKTWSFLKEHEALLARLNALGVRHQEIAAAQAAQAAQAQD